MAVCPILDGPRDLRPATPPRRPLATCPTLPRWTRLPVISTLTTPPSQDPPQSRSTTSRPNHPPGWALWDRPGVRDCGRSGKGKASLEVGPEYRPQPSRTWEVIQCTVRLHQWPAVPRCTTRGCRLQGTVRAAQRRPTINTAPREWTRSRRASPISSTTHQSDSTRGTAPGRLWKARREERPDMELWSKIRCVASGLLFVRLRCCPEASKNRRC